MDLCFLVYLFVLFVFANKLYSANDYTKCKAAAPLSSYFTELFLVVTYAIFILLALALLAYVFKRLAKKGLTEEEDDVEEWKYKWIFFILYYKLFKQHLY